MLLVFRVVTVLVFQRNDEACWSLNQLDCKLTSGSQANQWAVADQFSMWAMEGAQWVKALPCRCLISQCVYLVPFIHLCMEM